MDLFKLSGNERMISTSSLVMLVISAAYIYLRTGLSSVSQEGMILFAVSALAGFIGMSSKGGGGQFLSIASLTVSLLIILNVIFGFSFGLSVVG